MALPARLRYPKRIPKLVGRNKKSKTMKILRVLALAAILFAACDSVTTEEVHNQNVVEIEAPEHLSAEISGVARTYVGPNNYLRWTEGDEISYFPGVTCNIQYRFDGKTGDNSGSFTRVSDKLVTGNALVNTYSLYPYNSATSMSDEGIIGYTFPAEQLYAKNSFGLGANVMMAVTEGKYDYVLRFKNVGGYLKLKLYGEASISKIVLRGNNNEPLAGAATITGSPDEDPVVAMDASATKELTLNCGTGVALGNSADTATEFWFVLPETIFSKGITIVATDTNGNIVEKATSNSITVERNHIQPMQAIEFKVESQATPITATLTYEECKSAISGYGVPKSYTNSFGTWSICAYDNQNGIQLNKGKVAYVGTPTFEGDITKIKIDFAESYLGDIALCTECGTTTVAGQFESFNCNGKSMEYTLTTSGHKSLYIRATSSVVRITKITVETSSTTGGGNGDGTTPEPEPNPEEPEVPDTPIENDGIVGGWHLISFCGGSAEADIYMQLNSDKTFNLYQRTNSPTFVQFSGTYSLDESNTIISGRYSDGVAWANSYKYSINSNKELVFINTNNSTEISIYEPSAMPTTSLQNVSRAVAFSGNRPL